MTYEAQYHSPTDCRIFINDTWVDDACSVGYNFSAPKIPIYGYSDIHFTATAEGRRVVSGEFIMNYNKRNTLSLAILGEYSDSTSLMSSLSGNTSVSRAEVDTTASKGTGKTVKESSYSVCYNYANLIHVYCYKRVDTNGVFLGVGCYGGSVQKNKIAEARKVVLGWEISDTEITEYMDKKILSIKDSVYDNVLSATGYQVEAADVVGSSPNAPVSTTDLDELAARAASRIKKLALVMNPSLADRYKDDIWGNQRLSKKESNMNPSSLTKKHPVDIVIHVGPEDIENTGGLQLLKSNNLIKITGCEFSGEEVIIAHGMNDNVKVKYPFIGRNVN